MATQRPVLVTVLCILGFIGAPLMLLGSVVLMFPEFTASIGIVVPLWYAVFSLLLTFLYFVGLLFIWRMKKWGLIFYTALAAVEYIVAFAIGLGNYLMLAGTVIVLGLLWSQFRKMT